MAIEISFGIRGKETTQALFIQESEWKNSLAELRKMIVQQDLFVPTEYKFLTLSGNAIAHPSEETMTLKDITHDVNPPNEIKDEKLDGFELTDGKDDTFIKSCSPKIWIAALKVTFSDGSVGTEGAAYTADEDSLQQDDTETEPLLRDGTTTSSQDTSDEETPRQAKCSSCPYKLLMNFINGQGGPNAGMLLKYLLIMTFVLFFILASLTLTMHLLLRSFTGIGKSPAFNELFAKLDGGSSETVTKLQVQLSKLEVSSKYEIEQLTTRLNELEDLYLRDLALHKRELNQLKRQIAEGTGKFESEDQFTDAYEHSDKKHDSEKKKKSAGKGNKRFKG